MTTDLTVPDDVEAVALLDLEGTLMEDSASWARVNTAFGLSEERERALYRRHLTGEEYDIHGWAGAVAEAWSMTGEATRANLEAALEQPALPDHSHELVGALHDRGIHTLLISGAVDRFSRPAADRLGVDGHVPTVSITFDSDDTFDSLEFSTYIEKEDLARDLADAGHVVWAFGNGYNDIGMVEAADTAFMVPNRDGIDYEQIGAEPVERHRLAEAVRRRGY